MNKKVQITFDGITFSMSGKADSEITLMDVVSELENMIRSWGFKFDGELDIVESEAKE